MVDIRPEEVRAVGWCWLYIFAVLSSYYIMRPIRDQMGVAGGVNNLQWLFTGTLVGMLLLNLPFAWLVKKLPRSRFIPLTYHFFAVNIVLFAVALHWSRRRAGGLDRPDLLYLGSVYNLFVVSVFWQMNVDLFSPEQGKRLFGFIAAGATIGAIVGSAVTASLARYVSPTSLMVGAAACCSRSRCSASAAWRACRRRCTAAGRPGAAGRMRSRSAAACSAASLHAFRSPYLRQRQPFLLLFAITSTFLYFQQAAIVSHSFSRPRARRPRSSPRIDLVGQVADAGHPAVLHRRIIAAAGRRLRTGAAAGADHDRLRRACRGADAWA